MRIEGRWFSVCIALLGCGRATPGDLTGVSRAGEGSLQESEAHEPVVGDGQTPVADASGRLLKELAELPRLDVSESERTAPDCDAPTSVGLSEATFGARAARLLWDQETGECLLEDTDRSPEGLLGILTLRLKDGQASIASIGKWKFHAPPDLVLSDVPANEPFTIYPYLGEWQFVATLEHNTELLKLVEFAYLRGAGPASGGERQDVEDQAPSDFVEPILCAPKPEGDEAP